MKFLKGLMGFLNGSFVENGLKFINERWPPDMSEQQRAQMEMIVKEMLHKQTLELAEMAREDEKLFNERTKELEGTAADLKSVWLLGPIIIFLRGAFRPVFSYFVLYADYQYLIVSAMQNWTERQEALLFAVNLLVLIFFFGERAMKNVMPLLARVFEARQPTS